ncbi:MAG: hypothetical protein ACLGGV_05750 [Bacteroidia bacterium]
MTIVGVPDYKLMLYQQDLQQANFVFERNQAWRSQIEQERMYDINAFFNPTLLNEVIVVGVGRNAFDINASVNWLNNNSFSSYPAAKEAGCGASCARYIRYSLEAGSGLRRDAFLGRTPVPAREYGPFLESIGFNAINADTYLLGDIAVIQGYPGGTADANGVPYGHVQMYNGTQWISNYYQNDFWPGANYRRYQPAFQIYRYGNFP